MCSYIHLSFHYLGCLIHLFLHLPILKGSNSWMCVTISFQKLLVERCSSLSRKTESFFPTRLSLSKVSCVVETSRPIHLTRDKAEACNHWPTLSTSSSGKSLSSSSSAMASLSLGGFFLACNASSSVSNQFMHVSGSSFCPTKQTYFAAYYIPHHTSANLLENTDHALS